MTTTTATPPTPTITAKNSRSSAEALAPETPKGALEQSPACASDPELSLLGNLACLIDGVRSGVETYAADYALDTPETASDDDVDETYDAAILALMRGLGEYLLAATSIDDLDIEVALKRLGIADRIAA